ncbi:hypothetical protein Y032_0074g826 [Ancylostoma ceylanicum]|uniref:Uncharacterized protein n=1 Tax=Ancylostoma ceylanicum TaxID=53326 RepID=A0A016TWD6_9BILA|nr:hypothetical protein Y032_0074g826 [Ancylostoma ceylanicum]
MKMHLITLLLVCTTIGVVSSAKDCLRSGTEEDTVSYKGNQPLRKSHKLAVERIKKIYDKHSKEIGANPFIALEFANEYSLTLKHFTVLMGPGNVYSLESLTAHAQRTQLGPVEYSANLKAKDVVLLPKGVFDSTYNRCNQTALLNSVQLL